jgi:hypothetical protein
MLQLHRNTTCAGVLVRGRASGAKVIGLANGGTDLRNCIKQAAEFGITRNSMLLATLVMEITDVPSIGRDNCRGLVLTRPSTGACRPRPAPGASAIPRSCASCPVPAKAAPIPRRCIG